MFYLEGGNSQAAKIAATGSKAEAIARRLAELAEREPRPTLEQAHRIAILAARVLERAA
jgi:hypothetical protein